MNNEERILEMKQRLASLEPSVLEFEDQSHLHAGHPGAKSGAGHFALTIASSAFEGKSEVQKHRMIYQLVGDLIPSQVHALAIRTVAVNA